MVLLNGYLIYAKYDWKYATINNFTQQIIDLNNTQTILINFKKLLVDVEYDTITDTMY